MMYSGTLMGTCIASIWQDSWIQNAASGEKGGMVSCKQRRRMPRMMCPIRVGTK